MTPFWIALIAISPFVVGTVAANLYGSYRVRQSYPCCDLCGKRITHRDVNVTFYSGQTYHFRCYDSLSWPEGVA